MASSSAIEPDTLDRKQATLYIAPFLALGLLNLVTLLRWGLDPLWAFAIIPPMVFVTAIGWIAFRHGFHHGPTGTDSSSNR